MQLFFNVYFNLQHFLNKLLHQRVHIKYAVSKKGMIRRMHPLDYMQCVYNVQYDDMYDEMYDECMMNILTMTTALMENFDVESDFIASNYMYMCMHLHVKCTCKSL